MNILEQNTVTAAENLLRQSSAAAIYLPLADSKSLYMGSPADIASMLPDHIGAAVRGEAVAEDLREIDAVLAENDRLRDALAEKISGETLLTELNMNQGGLNMQFEGGACQMLAEQFAQQFREMGGDNYIEMGFTARSDGMPLLVTIQRVSGKTPATLKTEAEARLSTAKNFHRSLCDRFGYSHDDKDWLRDLVSLEEFIAAKVSARAADAHSEPSDTRDNFEIWARSEGSTNFMRMHGDSETYDDLILRAQFRSWSASSAFARAARSAADALDSQPTEPYDLQSNEQYRMQMAGISSAALGYVNLAEVSPEYMTHPLRDVVALYEKYAVLLASSQPTDGGVRR